MFAGVGGLSRALLVVERFFDCWTVLRSCILFAVLVHTALLHHGAVFAAPWTCSTPAQILLLIVCSPLLAGWFGLTGGGLSAFTMGFRALMWGSPMHVHTPVFEAST